MYLGICVLCSNFCVTFWLTYIHLVSQDHRCHHDHTRSRISCESLSGPTAMIKLMVVLYKWAEYVPHHQGVLKAYYRRCYLQTLNNKYKLENTTTFPPRISPEFQNTRNNTSSVAELWCPDFRTQTSDKKTKTSQHVQNVNYFAALYKKGRKVIIMTYKL